MSDLKIFLLFFLLLCLYVGVSLIILHYFLKEIKKGSKKDPFDVIIPKDFWEDILSDEHVWEDEDY